MVDENPGRSTYEWSTGETETIIDATEEGEYTVLASNGACESVKGIELTDYCKSKLYIPNAFTPNGEYVNDVFFPVVFGEITNYKLLIFNRWGEQIFSTTNSYEGWDGTYQGGECQIDVYVYKIFYDYLSEDEGEESVQRVGTVTLLR